MSRNGTTQDVAAGLSRLPWAFTDETCPDCGDEVVIALGEMGETSVECGCGSVLVLG